MLLELLFWACVGLLAYTHLGYPLLLAILRRLPGLRHGSAAAPGELPSVRLVAAAHDEEGVIGDWVAQALALDYPEDRLRVVVACDGCNDDTATRARDAGAHDVLELGRGGKVAALNAAVDEAQEEVLAFADANATWAPDALRFL